MKKFLITLLMIVLLGGASLIYFVAKSFNAEAYQQQIIQTVSELTGRKLSISGQTTLKWLPMPTFVMTGVYITNQGGSDRTNMLTADSVQVQIEWSSLFKTPLVVKSIEVTKPTLYLERLESNRANWDFPLFSAPDENINDAQLLGNAPALKHTKIDQLEIKGGSIFYVNKITKKTFEIKNIKGDLSIDSLKGPYTFKGSANIGKEQLSGSFNVGQIRNDSPASLTAKIEEKQSGLTLDFKGEITKNNPKSILIGDGSFSIKKPKTLLETVAIPVQNDILTQEIVGSFGVEITPLVDTLKNLIVRFGKDDQSFALTTTLAYTQETKTTPAKYEGELAINTLDVAAWEPYFKTVGWKQLGPDKKYPNLTLKTNITTVLIGEEPLQKVEGTLTYANDTFTIEDGRVILPGNTATTFSAETGAQDETPYLLIYATGKTNAVKPLASFFKVDALFPEATAVKSLDANARITLAPGFVSILLDESKIDAATVSGSVNWATDKKKAMVLDLNIDNLNLDTYTGWKNTEKTALQDVPTLLQKNATEAIALADADITFKINAKALTWHNLPMTTGTLQGNVKEGTLTLNALEFTDTATATLKTSGQVVNIGKPTAAIQSASFVFSAGQLPLFMERAGLSSTLPLFSKATEAQIAGSLSGSNNIWKTNLLAQVSDADIKMNGSLSGINDTLKFQDFNANISHPNFQKFLGLLDIKTDFVKNLNGALRAQGQLNGSLEDLKLTQLNASVGVQKISGTASFSNQAPRKLAANITSPALDLERFLPNTGVLIDNGKPSVKNFDFTSMDNWDVSLTVTAGRLTYRALDLTNAAATVTLKDKVLTVNNFTGSGRTTTYSPFKASGSLSWVTEPTLKLSLDMADVTIRPDFFIVNKFSFGDGKMALKGDFLTAGKTPAAMLANLGGGGSVTFTNGQFIGLDLAKIDLLIKKTMTEGSSQEAFDTPLQRLLQLGKTPVSTLSGAYTLTKGVLRFMDITVKTPTATATPTQLTVNLPVQSIDLSMPITLNTYTQFPPILLNASVDGAKRLYTSDTTDLSNAVLGVVKKEEAAQNEQAKQAQEQQEKEASANRQTSVKKAIIDANTLVKEVSKQLQAATTEQADRLLQNAADALAIVNQLAIKEKLTAQQEDKILEYARLAILKANEAKELAAKEGVTDYRQTVSGFETKGMAMVEKMKQLQIQQPQIAIIPRMVTLGEKNLATIRQVKTQIASAQKAGEAALLATATEAYKELENAYENVMKFDSEQVRMPPSEETSKPMRGTIRRPGIRG